MYTSGRELLLTTEPELFAHLGDIPSRLGATSVQATVRGQIRRSGGEKGRTRERHVKARREEPS